MQVRCSQAFAVLECEVISSLLNSIQCKNAGFRGRNSSFSTNRGSGCFLGGIGHAVSDVWGRLKPQVISMGLIICKCLTGELTGGQWPGSCGGHLLCLSSSLKDSAPCCSWDITSLRAVMRWSCLPSAHTEDPRLRKVDLKPLILLYVVCFLLQMAPCPSCWVLWIPLSMACAHCEESTFSARLGILQPWQDAYKSWFFLKIFFTPYFAKQCGKSIFFFKSFMKCTGYMAAEMKYKECLVSSVAIFMQRRSKSWSVTVSDLACLTCTSELCSAF